jgi:hypothetical protein
MKRTLAIALALVLALSLAACSGGNSTPSGGSSTTPPANSTTTTPPADNTPSGGNETTPNDNGGDTSTVAGYLAQFGLTEDDIKPENATEIKIQDGKLAITVSSTLTADQKKVWYTKLYNAISGISTGGKVKNGSLVEITNIQDEVNKLVDAVTWNWMFAYGESSYNTITVIEGTTVWEISIVS